MERSMGYWPATLSAISSSTTPNAASPNAAPKPQSASSLLHALQYVIYFAAVPIWPVSRNYARRLPFLDHVHCLGAAGEIEIKGRALAVERVGHRESFRKQPTAFRINCRTGRIMILGHDMVN